MKIIPLQSGRFTIIDDTDYDNVSRFKWTAHRLSGIWYAISTAYLGTVNSQPQLYTLLLHRLLMRPPQGMEVDHIDHNGLNNLRSNLRVCTTAQNQWNQRPRHGTSQYKGVHWQKQAKKWKAQIIVNNKYHYLGIFKNEIDAARAYNQATLEYRSGFPCYLNPV